VLLAALASIWVAMIVARSVEAQSSTIVFTAQLLPANEVAPVVVNAAELGVTGGATVTLDTVSSGGAITSATARFDVSLAGFPSNGTVILAHIHEAAANANGPVRVDSGITPATAVPIPGANSFTRTNLTVSPAVAQNIINNPAGFYFNVHSALSPGGVCRGQLVRQVTSGLTAPTLSEWGAILMTLLLLAVGVYFLIARGRVALAGTDASIATPARAIDWKLFAMVTLAVETIAAVALVLVGAGATDVTGALSSGLIAAFIIHLLIVNARRH
jgi:hypothetical protein